MALLRIEEGALGPKRVNNPAVDATRFAASLLQPIPANATFGIRVIRAVDGDVEMALEAPQRLLNVIGSLHSSGLTALVDAAGLAAIISCPADESEFAGATPLGAVAHLEFLAPARGVPVGHCAVDPDDRSTLRALFERRAERVTLTTGVEVFNGEREVVCRGSFAWRIRRVAAAA
jgi:acyl-coenzyme A thioesterase PaaI-like protein